MLYYYCVTVELTNTKACKVVQLFCHYETLFLFFIISMQGDSDAALSKDMADMHEAVVSNLTVRYEQSSLVAINLYLACLFAYVVLLVHPIII